MAVAEELERVAAEVPECAEVLERVEGRRCVELELECVERLQGWVCVEEVERVDGRRCVEELE